MPEREFNRPHVYRGEKLTTSMQIECAACDNSLTFFDAGHLGAVKVAEQYFRRHGWIVGKRAKGDRCPECQKRQPRIAVNNDKPAEEAIMAIAVPTSAEPPAEATREHNQIIFAKLQEVYVDTSYIAGWTDNKVGADLGCPPAWVAKIRDQFFGAAGSNPEIDRFLAQVETLKAERAALAEQILSVSSQFNETKRAISVLQERHADLIKHAERIMRIAKVK